MNKIGKNLTRISHKNSQRNGVDFVNIKILRLLEKQLKNVQQEINGYLKELGLN